MNIFKIKIQGDYDASSKNKDFTKKHGNVHMQRLHDLQLSDQVIYNNYFHFFSYNESVYIVTPKSLYQVTPNED